MMDPINELEKHKKLFKDNIRFLINDGKIDDASTLIKEYESFQIDDIDIINMKAIIQIMKGDLNEAEEILWRGVEIDHKNKDLLFNLGYLYEGKEEIQTAVNFYLKLLHETEDANEKREISGNILRLKLKGNTSEKKFIILSSCPWSLMLQRPHHIARALSRFGYSVDYVQPSNKATTQDSSITMENALAYSRNLTKNIGFVRVHTPVTVYHDEHFILNNYKEIVQEIIDSSNVEVNIICYFPSQIHTINQLTGNFRVIYECVDDHGDLEYSYWSSKSDREDEIKLLERADIITTTSSALYLSKSINRDNVYLSKNAVNIEDFGKQVVEKIPEDIAHIPGPRVCYVGAVDRWFDEELFYNVVRTNRDKSFIVIGPVKEGILAQEEPNLHILGLKEHKELKTYLRHMNVGIIPFKDDTDIIVNCDPIKMYEYVISGLPVVATNMPELVLGKDFIKVCNGLEEYNSALNESIQKFITKEEVEEFVKENTWHTRVKQILQIIEGETSQYQKNVIVNGFRNRWSSSIGGETNPILRSLYGLTFAESDIKRFYEISKEAYLQLNISFTLNNYVYASVLSNNVLECTETIRNDKNLSDVLKAELVFLIENNLHQLLIIRLLHIAKKFNAVKEEMSKITDKNSYDFELAHYHFAVGNYDKSFSAYDRLRESNIFKYSPVLNQNINQILVKNGKISEAKNYIQLLDKLVEKYLGKRIIPEIVSENKIRFSVVIPTRNSHLTLRHTLQTCLKQDFDNYEIIISDNSSNDLTWNLINEIGDSKIKYYKPNQELSMTENFNFAISKASGEYILVLGSDDGLLLHALKTLDDILVTLKSKIVHWYAVPYGWPDVKLEGYENYFQIPMTVKGKINHKISDSENVVGRVINYEIPYSALPMLYCNAVVHKDIISTLKETTGSVYKSLSPDVYSGFALTAIEKNFVTIDLPMTIGGSSGKSNGIAHVYGKDKASKDIKQDFSKLNRKSIANEYRLLPDVLNLEVAIAESFLTAKTELFSTNDRLKLNRKLMLQKSAENLVVYDENFHNNLQKLYSSVDDDAVLKEWFFKNYIERSNFGKTEIEVFNYLKGFSPNGGISFDLKDFDIVDVYGAAEFFRKVTNW